MKKKTAKIVKGGKARPKMDKAEVEALVQELSRPERLAREAERLLRRLRDDPALMGLRFEPEVLAGAAAEVGKEVAGDSPEAATRIARGIADRLVTDDFRAGATRALEARARAGGKLDDILPYRVGMHLIEVETDPAKRRPSGQNPFWLGVLSASGHEAPLLLYVEQRSPADIAAEAKRGAAAEGFKAFLESDARVKALKRAMPLMDLEAVLLHGLLGFLEAPEISLPLEATLRGPMEAARAALRRQALSSIGGGASREQEMIKTLTAAVEKDKDRAVAAYREEILERFAEAAAQRAEPATAAAAKRRLAALLAVLVALEALPASRNVPLLAAYESAAQRASDEASEAERPLLHAVLGRPLDAKGYHAYALKVLETDRPRAARFAAAAADAFPDDAPLKQLAADAAKAL